MLDHVIQGRALTPDTPDHVGGHTYDRCEELCAVTAGDGWLQGLLVAELVVDGVDFAVALERVNEEIE